MLLRISANTQSSEPELSRTRQAGLTTSLIFHTLSVMTWPKIWYPIFKTWTLNKYHVSRCTVKGLCEVMKKKKQPNFKTRVQRPYPIWPKSIPYHAHISLWSIRLTKIFFDAGWYLYNLGVSLSSAILLKPSRKHYVGPASPAGKLYLKNKLRCKYIHPWYEI